MAHDFTSNRFDDEPSPDHEPLAQSRDFVCPACNSRRTVPRDIGKKACAAIGTAAGAAGGISSTLPSAITGAEIGVAMAATAAASTLLGTVAGAILGGLSGGIAGCVVGAAFGEAIDDAILRNRRCLACGHSFSASRH